MQIEGTARVAIDTHLRVSMAATKMASAAPVSLKPAAAESASTNTSQQTPPAVTALDLAMETPVLNQPSRQFQMTLDIDVKKFLSMVAGLITDLDGEAMRPGGGSGPLRSLDISA